MTVVSYTGTANVRRIPKSALTGAGFNISTDIVWSKQNGYSVDVADPALVAFLLASGGFVADGITSFVDAVADLGGGGGGTAAPATLQDTSANLVAANAVHPAGLLIEAVDVNALSVGDGVTAYVDLPKYRSLPDAKRFETTVQQAGLINPTGITGLVDLAFTVGNTPVVLEAHIPHVQAAGGPLTAQLQIVDPAGNLKGYGACSVHAANMFTEVTAKERISAPGNYTRTVRIQRATGTGTITTLLNMAEVVGYAEIKPIFLP